MLRQKRDLQIDHKVGAQTGQRLRIDHVPGPQVADPPAAVDDIKNDQQQAVYRDHQPVAGAVVGDFHMLVIMVHPYIPIGHHFQR